MRDDELDRLYKRVKRTALVPSTLTQFVVMVFAVVVVWMFWANTSSSWALWAGAIKLDGSQVASTVATGNWGNTFGGFNALVGALGFGAVAITLNLQYTSFKMQSLDQHVSRFEGNFFRLIDLMIKLREDLYYEQTENYLSKKPNSKKIESITGHKAIEAAYEEVKYWVYKNHSGREKISKKIVAGVYDNFVHNRFEYCFATYFRILYTILNNIKKDRILSEEEKYSYANILRAQLTSFEIGLLSFNATSNYSKDLLDLMTHFRLLKYMPLKRRSVLGDIFKEEAFKARD